MGDVGGWAAYEGSKEARVTLRHTRQGQPRPALQVSSYCPDTGAAEELPVF